MMRPPVALLAHAGRRGAGAGERAAQVHVDHGVEVVVGHLPQHAVAQDAGVGDHDVEAAERVDGGCDQRLAVSVEPTAATTATAWPPAFSGRLNGLVGVARSTSFTTTDAPAAPRASTSSTSGPRPLP